MQAPSVSEPLPPTPESRRRLSVALVIGLLTAAAALLLFTWLGREILEGEVLAFDDRLRTLVHDVASPRLTTIMRAASLYGGPGVLVPAGLVAAVPLLRCRSAHLP